MNFPVSAHHLRHVVTHTSYIYFMVNCDRLYVYNTV